MPSWRRVDEPSTWANFSNTLASLSAGMPMPVSSTRTLSWTSAVDRLARDVDQHMTLLGEFHRVAEHVGDDLAEAADVADDIGGQARVDAHDEFEVLLGDARRRPARRRPRPPRRAGTGSVIERQLAGVDLREIENVVDDGEQRIARLDDDVGEGFLARRRVRSWPAARPCRARRSSACGSRGSYWRGIQIWRDRPPPP